MLVKTTSCAKIKSIRHFTRLKHYVIGGGTGFVGTALSKELKKQGHTVTCISRTSGPERITWDELKKNGLPDCDGLVNLAGNTTEADEESPLGSDFPATLVGLWEKAADHLDRSRVRHVRVRIGVVIGSVEREGWMKWFRIGRARGFLPIIRLPFCLGLGGIPGSGKQLFPWVHIDDITHLIIFLLNNPECHGRYNAVSPGIVTQETFIREFARRLRRPVVWHIPEWLINWVVHEERSSILLKGMNVKPKRTLAAGYKFLYPEIGPALDNLVKITF